MNATDIEPQAIVDGPPPTFGRLAHPELTQALINAERAGFLRGLGVAALVCRERKKLGCAYLIEALDGQNGADVREHCGQFAWAAGEEAGDGG